jgi:hypothetical protein
LRCYSEFYLLEHLNNVVASKKRSLLPPVVKPLTPTMKKSAVIGTGRIRVRAESSNLVHTKKRNGDENATKVTSTPKRKRSNLILDVKSLKELLPNVTITVSRNC